MPNTVYENFYLTNEIEDQYNPHLDLQQFCTVDNTLYAPKDQRLQGH